MQSWEETGCTDESRPSTLHQKLRIPTKDEIIKVNNDQVATKQCILAAIDRKVPKGINSPRVS